LPYTPDFGSFCYRPLFTGVGQISQFAEALFVVPLLGGFVRGLMPRDRLKAALQAS
jgi:hypothetical protein